MNEQLLERIASALENLNPKATTPLGFCEPPMAQHIYVVNDSEQGLWYFLGENSTKHYIPQRALNCQVKSMEIVRREYKSKEQLKLDITVEADKTYVLRTGFNTTFCRGLLLAMNTLNKESINKPLIIAIAPGEEKVAFARVYDAISQTPITNAWNKEIDLMPILQKLQSFLGESRETRIAEDSAPPLSLPTEIWRNWKSPSDAIAWAVTQLPDVPRDVLEAEFEELETTNGKKADRWVARVEDLKVEVF